MSFLARGTFACRVVCLDRTGCAINDSALLSSGSVTVGVSTAASSPASGWEVQDALVTLPTEVFGIMSSEMVVGVDGRYVHTMVLRGKSSAIVLITPPDGGSRVTCVPSPCGPSGVCEAAYVADGAVVVTCWRAVHGAVWLGRVDTSEGAVDSSACICLHQSSDGPVLGPVRIWHSTDGTLVWSTAQRCGVYDSTLDWDSMSATSSFIGDDTSKQSVVFACLPSKHTVAIAAEGGAWMTFTDGIITATLPTDGVVQSIRLGPCIRSRPTSVITTSSAVIVLDAITLRPLYRIVSEGLSYIGNVCMGAATCLLLSRPCVCGHHSLQEMFPHTVGIRLTVTPENDAVRLSPPSTCSSCESFAPDAKRRKPDSTRVQIPIFGGEDVTTPADGGNSVEKQSPVFQSLLQAMRHRLATAKLLESDAIREVSLKLENLRRLTSVANALCAGLNHGASYHILPPVPSTLLLQPFIGPQHASPSPELSASIQRLHASVTFHTLLSPSRLDAVTSLSIVTIQNPSRRAVAVRSITVTPKPPYASSITARVLGTHDPASPLLWEVDPGTAITVAVLCEGQAAGTEYGVCWCEGDTLCGSILAPVLAVGAKPAIPVEAYIQSAPVCVTLSAKSSAYTGKVDLPHVLLTLTLQGYTLKASSVDNITLVETEAGLVCGAVAMNQQVSRPTHPCVWSIIVYSHQRHLPSVLIRHLAKVWTPLGFTLSLWPEPRLPVPSLINTACAIASCVSSSEATGTITVHRQPLQGLSSLHL